MGKAKPVFLSLLGLTTLTLFYGALSHFKKSPPPVSPIKWIAQTGPIKEGIQTHYLAELLHLSLSHPKSINPEEAQVILQAAPFIKKVAVNFLNPETLYIDYTLRRPHFYLSDFSNIGVDETGHLFPMSPIFTPKKLPRLFLGLQEKPPWDEPIEKQKIRLANHLANYFDETVHVIWIDLAPIEANTLGKREIILILENEQGAEHFLRLTPKSYEKELMHYLLIREKLREQNLEIDLRTPNRAYLNQVSEKSYPPTP